MEAGKSILIKCEHLEKEMEFTDERFFIHIGNRTTIILCELCKAMVVEKLFVDLLDAIIQKRRQNG